MLSCDVCMCRRGSWSHSLTPPTKVLPRGIQMQTPGVSESLSRKVLSCLLLSLIPRTLDFTVSQPASSVVLADAITVSVACPTCIYVDERVGQLCCVLKSPEVATNVKSQLVPILRRIYSNPPNHGARIVATALNNPSLYQEW